MQRVPQDDARRSVLTSEEANILAHLLHQNLSTMLAWTREPRATGEKCGKLCDPRMWHIYAAVQPTVAGVQRITVPETQKQLPPRSSGSNDVLP